MIENKIYTVSELVSKINDTLKEKILVKGEVANFKEAQDRFVFFDIKDENGIISCFLFKQNYLRLGVTLNDGDEITIHGHFHYHGGRGKLSLLPSKIQLTGEGALRKQYEELKKKLLEQGIFDEKFKQRLPSLPKKIAIVTSKTGSVLDDILRTLSHRNTNVQVLLANVNVQGIFATDQMYAAIKSLNENHAGNTDIIVVARGGGSFTDLQPFNEEKLVRAVFASKIPVVTAIGHDEHVTLCDLASDLAVSTPTQAAEKIMPTTKELMQKLQSEVRILKKTFSEGLNRKKSNLKLVISNLKSHMNRKIDTLKYHQERLISHLAQMKYDIDSNREKIQAHIITIKNKFKSKVDIDKQTLKRLTNAIGHLNPKNVLKRGYSISYVNNKVVLDFKKIQIGDKMVTVLADGQISSTVREKNDKTDI